MSALVLNQTVLVSVRKDLIIFFRKNIEPYVPIKVVNELSDEIINLYSTVLLDMSILNNQERVIANLDSIKKSIVKFIFIIDSLIPNNVVSDLFTITKQVIPYPCNPKIIKNYLNSKFSRKEGFISPPINLLGTINQEDALITSKLFGDSASIRELKNKIICYSKIDGPVLLLGESGTGKTTAAKIIHDLSRRNACSFIPVNCAAFTENLIDSALFGTMDGAFTDAKFSKGYIKKAAGGTLFLDEIGMASLDLQGKLKMFLDSGIIYSVGSYEAERIDTRMIFATNDDLKLKIMEKHFLQDFYYRIYVNVIIIPPLRNRREDIPVIANSIAEKNGKYISPIVMRKLEEYDWPGNVRQLINCMERAITINNGEVIKEENIFFGI